MHVIDSLDLTARQRRENDAEALTRLAERPGPVDLRTLFGGRAPTWAADACDRLSVAGLVREVDGKVEVTDAGRKALRTNAA